jgi:hypothetical protein
MRYRNGLVFTATVAAILYVGALVAEKGEPAAAAPAPAVEQPAPRPVAEVPVNKQMIAFVIGTRHMCNDVTKVLPTDKPKVYRVTCHSAEGAIATHDFLYDEPGNKITPL